MVLIFAALANFETLSSCVFFLLPVMFSHISKHFFQYACYFSWLTCIYCSSELEISRSVCLYETSFLNTNQEHLMSTLDHNYSPYCIVIKGAQISNTEVLIPSLRQEIGILERFHLLNFLILDITKLCPIDDSLSKELLKH